MKPVLLGLGLALLLLPALALAAGDPDIPDLLITWDALTVDDTGAALPGGAPEEYRIYACGLTTPLATVAGTEVSFTEADVVTGSGSHCREVSAFLSPFEGSKGQATVVLVVPGTVQNVNVQAVP